MGHLDSGGADVRLTYSMIRGRLALRIFFFQAEDGIRDKLVTGVQTCALPISEGPEVEEDELAAEVLQAERARGVQPLEVGREIGRVDGALEARGHQTASESCSGDRKSVV